MNKSKMAGRIVALLVMTLAMALLATPAWAATFPIANHATLIGASGSVDLYGMDSAAAQAAIASVCPEPPTGNLTIVVNGKKWGPVSTRGLTWRSTLVDKTAIINDAMTSRVGTDTFNILPQFKVDERIVGQWVTRANDKYRVVMRNASLAITDKVVLVPCRVGISVYYRPTVAAIVRALKLNAAAGTGAPMTVTATLVLTKPKENGSGFNKLKTIIVVVSKRQMTLWLGTKIYVRYACAVGQPRYPTPKGIWKVVDKVWHPSWYNPGSAWARNMPSMIGPGASNPLGLAALYLNAPGIRIHGTKNIASLGTAASHGCIRLANSNIVKLYPIVPIGTKVYIVK